MIGYFIPARVDLNRAALNNAAAQMDALLKREGLTDAELDEVTRDFRRWRKKSRK